MGRTFTEKQSKTNIAQPFTPLAILRSWHHFLFLENIEKKIKKKLSKVLNTFENIMKNGAFALMEQMFDFQNISKYSIKGVIMG